MRVLVTGAEGYIGRRLVKVLQERGHDITGLDTGYYSDRTLYDDPHGARILKKDIRRVTEGDVHGYDAVVHLAELSNDPAGQFRPDVTYEINHHGTVALARLCKASGVSRFVYTSSCSVYGAGGDRARTEESPVSPQTAYARCKVLVEDSLSAMADSDFSPTFLRNATAYGPSPSMRFDIVLNNLAAWAWTEGRIVLNSDGSAWRPLVHVLDICEAIACTLEAPRRTVHGQIFNVGHNDENYRVVEIADIVARSFSGCPVEVGPPNGDTRSYRVDFSKISTALPGFACRRTARMGAAELRQLFGRIGLSVLTFNAPTFTRLRQLERLAAAGQLDACLHWVGDESPVAGRQPRRASSCD